MKPSIVVVGGGGHAKVVIDSLRASAQTVAGFTDANPESRAISGAPYLGPDSALESISTIDHRVIVALGNNRLRARLMATARDLGFSLANAIHPSASISPSAQIGEGVVVMAQAAINADASIGAGAIINTGATIDHDCRIGACVHIAPGCHLAGYVTVGEGALVGVGASVGRGQALAVGAWCIVGTGSVVVGDVGPGLTVAGNPCRPIARRPE